MGLWTESSLVQVMAPMLFEAITWANADLLSMDSLGTNYGEIWLIVA